jgi:hypothetical protein
MVSLPRPTAALRTAVDSVGRLAHKVLTKGLSTAQSVVDRLPGAEPETSARREARIGANPQRRYGSRNSRSLAR